MVRTVYSWKDLKPEKFEFQLKTGTSQGRYCIVTHSEADRDFLVATPAMKTLWPKLTTMDSKTEKFELDLHVDDENEEHCQFLAWLEQVEKCFTVFMMKGENMTQLCSKPMVDISPLRKDCVKRTEKGGTSFPPYMIYRNASPAFMLNAAGNLDPEVVIEKNDRVAAIFSFSGFMRPKTDFGLRLSLIAAVKVGKYEKSKGFDLENVPDYRE